MATLLLSLLCWMYFDTTGYRARKSGITDSLIRGDIGKLNSEDSQELKATINWLAQAAGVPSPIELNRPPSEDRLTVYTTTPAAERLTRCSKGNVVFDAEMNAIFVDIDLLRTYELRSIFEATDSGPPKNFQEFRLSDLPGFYRAYIWFALLHELGHWKFHRSERRIFDSTRLADFKADDREELEADRFALQAMVVAYTADMAAGGHKVLTLAGDTSFALSVEPGASMASRVCADVGAMFSMLTDVTMFTSTPFAPFYHDRTHPNLVSRVIRIGNLCLSQSDLSSSVRKFLSSALSLQNSISSLMGQPLVEVIAPFQIEDVTFEDHSVLISIFGTNSLVRVPMQEVEQRMQSRGPTALFLKGPPFTSTGPLAPGPKFVWSNTSSGVMKIQASHVYRAGDSSWVPLADPIPNDFEHAKIHALLTPPQPSELAFLLLSGNDGRPLHIDTIVGDSVVASRTLQEIQDEAASRGILADTLEPNTVRPDGVFVTLGKDEGQGRTSILGAVFLDGKTLQSLRWFGKPRMPKPGNIDYRDHLIVGPDLDFHRYTLIETLMQKPSPPAWTIWRLSEDGDPVEVKTGPPLRSGVGVTSNDSIGSVPTLAKFSFLPPNFILLNFSHDSVYALSPADGRMALLFPFGDDVLLRQRISNTGIIATFVENGYKVYLSRSTLTGGS